MKGLIAWQESHRKDTLKNIEEAMNYLETHNLPINRKAIAKEAGVSRQTMNALYIQIHLKKFKYFNKELQNEGDDIEENIVILGAENKKLRDENIRLKAQNKFLRDELKQKNLEMKDSQMEYQRLLGAYQQNVNPKITYLK